jgi:broad specificity phosphatase PhoE
MVKSRDMPQQLIFVRHGETTNNVEGRLMGWEHDYAHLTKQGQEDAKQTAKNLAGYKIDHIYHSDLIRTTETAAIICKALGRQSEPTHYLRERNLGTFADRTWQDLRENSPAEFAKFIDHEDAEWNGLKGESLNDMAKRFNEFLAQLHSSHQGQTVLLVTHSGFLHTILRDVFDFFPKHSFTEVGHSSITILEKSGGTYTLKLYNHTK